MWGVIVTLGLHAMSHSVAMPPPRDYTLRLRYYNNNKCLNNFNHIGLCNLFTNQGFQFSEQFIVCVNLEILIQYYTNSLERSHTDHEIVLSPSQVLLLLPFVFLGHVT